MPRFNSLRLASTGFTSWIDYYQWHSSPGLCVLPLTERMFHYELDLWQFSTRGDRTNPDRVAHNQYDVGRFRASHSEKVVTGRSLVHTISWSLFLSLSLFCCSRLGESDEIYALVWIECTLVPFSTLNETVSMSTKDNVVRTDKGESSDEYQLLPSDSNNEICTRRHEAQRSIQYTALMRICPWSSRAWRKLN